jgi:formylmethanofuran dehydrogenase subunit B
MDRAFVEGRPVALDAAIAEAARLLGTSRLPVIAGLDCDVLGARAAVALARRLGGVVDHADFSGLKHTFDAVHDAGALVTTPNEARLRADTLLMIGPNGTLPDLVERVRPASESPGGATPDRMVWLCAGRKSGDTRDGRVVGGSMSELPGLLAALRARVGERPVQSQTSSPRRRGPTAQRREIGGHGFPLSRERLGEVDALASELKEAKFGVAVWWPPEVDALTTEMLFGLIDDLNAHTRFAAVPVWSDRCGPGVMQACGWLSGFAPPVGFGRGIPEHDPWRFDAIRLVEGGEADCALWISVQGMAVPFERPVPSIVIGHYPRRESAPAHSVHVHIDVGLPGIDHDALLHDLDVGTITPKAASRPSDMPSAADILARIAAALPERAPC